MGYLSRGNGEREETNSVVKMGEGNRVDAETKTVPIADHVFFWTSS